MKNYLILAGFLLCSITVSAQAGKNTFGTSGWWGPPQPKFSPVVHEDNSITFRIDAPHAERVELWFDERFYRRHLGKRKHQRRHGDT
ncbi:MAG: hypothetical protein V2B15_12740 [Bacteroidota bacterium]